MGRTRHDRRRTPRGLRAQVEAYVTGRGVARRPKTAEITERRTFEAVQREAFKAGWTALVRQQARLGEQARTGATKTGPMPAAVRVLLNQLRDTMLGPPRHYGSGGSARDEALLQQAYQLARAWFDHDGVVRAACLVRCEGCQFVMEGRRHKGRLSPVPHDARTRTGDLRGWITKPCYGQDWPAAEVLRRPGSRRSR